MPHMSAKPWLVQKYGGTSIGKLLPTITGSIIPEYLEVHNVAVVCSARSGLTKSTGTTSMLLEAMAMAVIGDIKFEIVVESIREDHMGAVEQAVCASMGDTLRDVQLQIKKDCTRLLGLLNATMMLGEISDRTADRVLSFGELLSCRVVAASLVSKGIAAKVVVLDDVVEEAYGEDQTRIAEMFNKHPATFLGGLKDAIAKRLESCKSAVPVVTGFFGAMPGSLLKCVSRGYSDLCAALCAVALSSVELQIWKEVDGVFTADPRKIKTARLLATITSEEAAELTFYGSEVIHPLTIEQIAGAEIPLRLKNVMNPRGEGTIVHCSRGDSYNPTYDCDSNESKDSDDQEVLAASKMNLMVANGYYGPSQHRRRPTAITAKEDIVILNVRSHGTCTAQAFFSNVSACLEAHSLVVDLTSSSQQTLSLAICAPNRRALESAVKRLNGIGIVNLMEDMSIISVIGHKMRNMVGVGAEIFTALAHAKINIYLISQGASEINISFVVNARDGQLAMDVVHEKVLKIPHHEERENAFVKGPWLY